MKTPWIYSKLLEGVANIDWLIDLLNKFAAVTNSAVHALIDWLIKQICGNN